MQVVSPRVSILKKENVLSIVILSSKDKLKLNLLFLWLLAWSVCGVIVLANYFTLHNQNAKLFMIVYLSFWAYYEYTISRSFVWKKFGKEKIWIQNNQLHYQRLIRERGKIKSYSLDLIGEVEEIEKSKSGFNELINNSFWVKGGEYLQFYVQSKKIIFGMQLNENEVKIILKELKAWMKR